MKTFKVKSKLMKVSLTFLVNANLKTNYSESRDLYQMFMEIDRNRYGLIQIDDFVQYLQESFWGNVLVTPQESVEIFNDLNDNLDKNIQYSEFLTACFDKKQFLNDINIEQCWNYLTRH